MKRIVTDELERVSLWVAKQCGAVGYTGGRQTLGLEQDGELVAGVVYDNWNRASIHAHIAVLPNVWPTREFLRVGFSYPFQQLRVNKLLGFVGSGNVAARRLDEHLGFVLEATLEAAHPDGALLVYSMTREQCRWLPRNTLKDQQNVLSRRTGTD